MADNLAPAVNPKHDAARVHTAGGQGRNTGCQASYRNRKL